LPVKVFAGQGLAWLFARGFAVPLIIAFTTDAISTIVAKNGHGVKPDRAG
jgi:hypothetical protein